MRWLHLVAFVVEAETGFLPEPVFEGKRHLAQVLLPENTVLVPYHDLERAETIGERDVERKVEWGVFVLGIGGALAHGCLMARVEKGDDDETSEQ